LSLAAISVIQGVGILGHALLPNLKLPMIATRDVGDYAAQRLLDLDFSGKQPRELLGKRDLSMAEATTIIARGIGKPDLRYEQFPYDQSAAGVRANGHAAEESRGVHRDVQGDQRRCPCCAGAAFAREHHTDFV
jgi:uncharacterized protein YbjT (DUF2867 family)